MTNQEAINMLKSKMDGHTDTSYEWAETVRIAIKALEQAPCDDAISRQAVLDINFKRIILTTAKPAETIEQKVKALPSVNPQEPKTGHWCRKTKVDAYDIAGVKTWGIKCQCDRCDFATIVVEDFGYYKYCPNCGAKMVEPQESERT